MQVVMVREAVQDVSEKMTHELEAAKTRYELLQHEKEEQKREYEERLRQMRSEGNASLAAVQDTHEQKLMAEVLRYHDVVAKQQEVERATQLQMEQV